MEGSNLMASIHQREQRRLASILLSLCLFFLAIVSGIRDDFRPIEKEFCKNTVQGRYLLSDDHGHVCDVLSIDPWSQCCPERGERFSCQGCNLVSQCCNSYEYCVSCCLSPDRTNKEFALKVRIGKPVTAGTYASVFDFCAGRCRHNSASVVHENAYASDFHHCFSLQPNTSGPVDATIEERLAGINVFVGRQGQSCNSVCKSQGQSCVVNKLLALNTCEMMQRYMSCKGACVASRGVDQPAEVADNAPKHMNPGSCLYTQTLSELSCEGCHSQTKRLCPCA
ncbi:hypothetical protein AMTRI_Chr06g177710 [Amborella trichopoda]|uniref:uncharacterized protein LOC18441839 n=1 Tax=Amborella trichopoda TaxID=13333 RepID=UPI0005D3E5CE|nr:uncharacterized protein LOC18441839 [Amborella trichopoda]|eukprot:XP_011626141.1 uncharacterized protein LOC18441839 [Amborella trichopoda]